MTSSARCPTSRGDRAGDRARCRRSAAPGAGRSRAAGRSPPRDVGLTVSADDDHATHGTVPADRDRGLALRLRLGHARPRGRPAGAATTRSSSRVRPTSTDGSCRRPRRPPGRRARRCSRSPRRRAARPTSLGRGRGDRPRDRVLGRVLQRPRRAAAAWARSLAVGEQHVDERHPPGRHGAGLVQHDRVDAAGRLQHLRAPDEDAELRAAAGADHERGRRRQAERARAGDDQHGDGGRERRLGRRRRCRARSRAWPAASAMTTGTNTRRDPVGEPLHGGLAGLRLLDQTGHPGELGVGADARRPDDSRPPALTVAPTTASPGPRPRPAPTRR